MNFPKKDLSKSSPKSGSPGYKDKNTRRRINRSIAAEQKLALQVKAAKKAKKQFEATQAYIRRQNEIIQSQRLVEQEPEPLSDSMAAETMFVFTEVLQMKQHNIEDQGVATIDDPIEVDLQSEIIINPEKNLENPHLTASDTETVDACSLDSSASPDNACDDDEELFFIEKTSRSSKTSDVFSVFYNICHQYGLNDRAIVSISGFINALLTGEFGDVNAKVFPKSTTTFRRRLTGPTTLGVRYHWCCPGTSGERACGKWLQCAYENKLGSLQCCGIKAKPTHTHFFTFNVRAVLTTVLPNVFPFISEKLLDYAGFRRIRDSCMLTADDVILILNSDGVALANSSRKDAWLVLGSIAGTPEFLRFEGSNTLGIWTTIEDKINIQEMLHQVTDQIIETQRNPITWTDKDGKLHHTRVFLGPVATDSQARPKLTGLPHFMHTYGCITCTQGNPGHYFSDTKEHLDRTHANYELAAIAHGLKRPSPEIILPVNEKEILMREYPLTFRSPLCDIPGFDIIEGMPLDSMHAFGHGVFPEWLKLLLNLVKNSSKVSSLPRPSAARRRQESDSGSSTGSCLSKPMPKVSNTAVSEVSSLLKRIKPPVMISRRPRGLEHSAHFKANEWTAATTVYLPPILRNRIPQDRIIAYVELLRSFESLNRHGQSEKELLKVEQALQTFSSHMRLGGTEKVKYNIHQLRHCTKFYRLWGPLYVYSTAAFENFNGLITRGLVKNQHAVSHFVKNYSNFLVITGGVRPKFRDSYGSSKAWTKVIGDTVTINLRQSMILHPDKQDGMRRLAANLTDKDPEAFHSYKFYRQLESKYPDGHQISVYAWENTGDVTHNSSFFLTETGSVVKVLYIALDELNDSPKLLCEHFSCRRLESTLRNFLVPVGSSSVLEICPAVLRKSVVLIEDGTLMYFAVLNTSVLVSHQ